MRSDFWIAGLVFLVGVLAVVSGLLRPGVEVRSGGQPASVEAPQPVAPAAAAYPPAGMGSTLSVIETNDLVWRGGAILKAVPR